MNTMNGFAYEKPYIKSAWDAVAGRVHKTIRYRRATQNLHFDPWQAIAFIYERL